MRKTIFLTMMMLNGMLSASHHKIQMMLTVPRTVSTAFEKSMMARGDHKVFHEPYDTSYFYHQGHHEILSQLPPQELIEAKNYAEVKALIYRHAEERPIYFKDMIWCVEKEILSDDALFADPDVIVTILIRDPARSIESWYEELTAVGILNEPDVFRYDALVKFAEKYKQVRGVWPIIIEAEDLCKEPAVTMQAFCTQAGISYIPEALSWKEGMPEEWKPLSNWHRDAANSNGFHELKRDGEEPSFSKIPASYVPKLKAICEKQMPFYEALRKMKRSSAKMGELSIASQTLG